MGGECTAAPSLGRHGRRAVESAAFPPPNGHCALSWSLAAAPHHRIGHAIEAHDAIGSTNDRAREALREPDGIGRVILAELQTAGRGRRGRTWDSPSGVNLTFSVGVRPELAARDAWRLAAAAGLAVRAAARPFGIVSLKWPNDVVDGAGRKVAGILIETVIDGEQVAEAVIGIGINVNWRRDEMPAELRPRASSLAELAARPIDRVDLLRALLEELDAWVARAEGDGSVLDAYRAASWLTGRSVEVEAGDRRLRGIARDVTPDGSLPIEGGGEAQVVSYGEVTRVLELEPVPVQ
jgi:BirA family biotin operon repressor/biotin-[acetyl-CoA-carboxylase] ligase